MGPAADSAASPRESRPAADIRFRSWAGLLRPAHIHARAIGLLVIRCRSVVPLSSPPKPEGQIQINVGVPNRHSRRDLAILVYNSFRFVKNDAYLPRPGFPEKPP